MVLNDAIGYIPHEVTSPGFTRSRFNCSLEDFWWYVVLGVFPRYTWYRSRRVSVTKKKLYGFAIAVIN